MIVGFNHNVSYKAVGFHVQTEDSGVKSPQLVTLLYHSGTIIASQKTVYADIIKVDNLSQVVEDLAKEQHKGMLRKLTQGEFDERILALGIAIAGSAPPAKEAARPVAAEVVASLPEPVPLVVEEPEPAPLVIEAAEPAPLFIEESEPVSLVVEEIAPAPLFAEPESEPEVVIVEVPLVDKFRKPAPQARQGSSLDELIYAYLSGAKEI